MDFAPSLFLLHHSANGGPGHVIFALFDPRDSLSHPADHRTSVLLCVVLVVAPPAERPLSAPAPAGGRCPQAPLFLCRALSPADQTGWKVDDAAHRRLWNHRLFPAGFSGKSPVLPELPERDHRGSELYPAHLCPVPLLLHRPGNGGVQCGGLGGWRELVHSLDPPG